jgi:hypothetical protein
MLFHVLRLSRAYSAVVAYGYEGWKASPDQRFFQQGPAMVARSLSDFGFAKSFRLLMGILQISATQRVGKKR